MLKYTIIIVLTIVAIGIGHLFEIQQMVIGGVVALLCTMGVFIGQNIKHRSVNRIPKKEINKAIVIALIALSILFLGFTYKNGQYLIFSLVLNLLLAVYIFCRLKKVIYSQQKANTD